MPFTFTTRLIIMDMIRLLILMIMSQVSLTFDKTQSITRQKVIFLCCRLFKSRNFYLYLCFLIEHFGYPILVAPAEVDHIVNVWLSADEPNNRTWEVSRLVACGDVFRLRVCSLKCKLQTQNFMPNCQMPEFFSHSHRI